MIINKVNKEVYLRVFFEYLNKKDINDKKIPICVEIDKFDMKILYHMDRMGDINIAAVAKEINRSKSFIKYRVDRLKKSGVLLNFFPIFDVGKLNYAIIDIYFLINANESQEKAIIDFFKKESNVNCIEKYIGPYNLYVSYFVKNLIEFEKLMEKICSKFENTILRYEMNIIHETYTCSHNYLEYPKYLETYRANYDKEGSVKISVNEFNLMKQLEQDPLQTNIDLSSKLNLDPKTVSKIKENLKDKQVLYAIRPSLNSGCMGYITKHLLLDLKLNKYHKRKQIIDFLLTKKYTMFISLVLNSNKLTAELVFKDLDEFRGFEQELIQKFEEIVLSYNYLDKYKEIKYTYLPPVL